MKLIKRTYIYTSIWLIPIFLIGSLFSFLMIEYIAYEETDEFLTYEMERLIQYHEKNDDLPDFANIAGVFENQKYEKPFFKDTLLLESGDNEMVPYRELWFSINHNSRDFTIVLRHLLPGRDDIAQGTLLIIGGLLLLIAMFLILTVNMVTGKIWAPFYQTLDKITRFKINDPVPGFAETDIDEFKSLNTTLQALLKKVSDDYRHNKEFNENASHEIQTHLAVIRANAGKLLDSSSEDVQKSEEISKIYSAATKLSQVQKSLLLLSKINNREFNNNITLNLEETVKGVLGTFSEAINLRGINLFQEIAPCTVVMDAGLAEILINNLIKNAVKHNIQQGYISVKLSNEMLIVENSGLPYLGNPESLLQRFAKGETGNIGIGLAIVKEICELYNFSLSYKIEGSHHKISVFFNPT